MLNQSFRQVFVSNIPALLPNGKTVENIAVGQVGILDAKSMTATTAPTYGKNKALKLVWGTPNIEQMMFFGYNNQNEYSKMIKGRLLRNFRGHKASRGQHQLVTVGFSGDVSDTDTLFAKPGEMRELFLHLTGDVIDREFSNQGLMRRYFYQPTMPSDCEDACANVDCRAIAENLVKQINADRSVNRYVKASVITTCDPALPSPTTVTVYKFRLITVDSKDNIALGLVQAQYPNDTVTRIGEEGLASVYEVVRTANTLPTAFTTAGTILIPDCDVCPTGYTLVNNGFAYKITRQDAGDGDALLDVAGDYGIVNPETVSRVAYDFGQSTYVVVSATALTALNGANEVQRVTITGTPAGGTFTLTFAGQTTAAIAYNASASAVRTALEALSNIEVGDVTTGGGALPGSFVTVTFGGQYAGTNVPAMTANGASLTGGTSPAVAITTTTAGSNADVFESLGEVRDTCVLNTPVTTAWVTAGTLTRYAKLFRITLADDVCGNDRLAALQAAFPDLVVTLVNASGNCVHTYQTTTYSQGVNDDCSVEDLRFPVPDKFEGALWVEVPADPLPDGTTCLCGIKFEVAVVHRQTNECTFDSFPYDASAVFLEVSSGNADWNSQVPLENEWVVKYIQGVKFPQGAGGYIQRLEKESLGYSDRYRDSDALLRELKGYQFQARNGVFYDEYVIEFDFSYNVGGWGQHYTDSYSLFVYFPEGEGKAFEAAVNSYISSAGIDIDPVVL